MLIFNKFETTYCNNYRKNFSSTHWEIDLYKDIEQGTCKLHLDNPNAQGFLVGNSYEQSIPIDTAGGKILNTIKKLGINTTVKGHMVGATDFKKMNSKEVIKKRIATCEKVNNKTATLLSLDMVEVGQGYQAVKEINMKRIEEFSEHKKSKPSKEKHK